MKPLFFTLATLLFLLHNAEAKPPTFHKDIRANCGVSADVVATYFFFPATTACKNAVEWAIQRGWGPLKKPGCHYQPPIPELGIQEGLAMFSCDKEPTAFAALFPKESEAATPDFEPPLRWQVGATIEYNDCGKSKKLLFFRLESGGLFQLF